MTNAELDHAVEAEKRLAKRLDRYAGSWVAIRDHKVVKDAPTLKELLDQIDAQQIDRVLEVSEEPAAGCYF